MRKISYILLAVLVVLTSCHNEPENPSSEGGPEIRKVEGIIGEALTRAGNNYTDYVGRDAFEANDVMILTSIKRTNNPLSAFTYVNAKYQYSNDGWERSYDSGFEQKERIYWSDNASGHTFIGYSTPQNWVEANGNYKEGKWAKNDDGSFSGQFSYKTAGENKIVDFSAADKTIDDKTGKLVDFVGQNLKKEDLLLTYATDMHPDQTGLVTTIHYRHALASLRVVINIQGFSPSSTAQDVKTTIENLIVKNQPYKYTWTQAPRADVHGIDVPGWGVGNNTDAGDVVDIKAWQPRSDGEGSGEAKKFTFYSLIVPGVQNSFEIQYTVKYPNYLNPAADFETNTYDATLKNSDGTPASIKFLPGYCTTVKVSLNHEGEPIYLGAEYIDWENVETPDKSELQKISIFLDTNGRSDVTIATDDGANKDDATWLYYLDEDKNNETTGNVVDIYGHTGTQTDPYLIKTARQLLSFAYEVQYGRTFNMQYIKLDSDIYLQKTTNNNDNDIIWPGIGDESHPFNGFFLGGDRKISRLKGNPLFGCIGETAVVDKINIDDVLGVTGCGVIAHKNLGLICGCFIDGDVTAEPEAQYCGSIVGENQSFIIACAHVGKVTGSGIVGGLVGFNNGTVIACYHSGEVIGTGNNPEVHATVGKRGDGTDGTNNSIMFSCYFDESLISHTPTLVPSKSGFPLSTIMMQNSDFVNGDKEYKYYGQGGYMGQGQTLKEVLLFLLYTDDDSDSDTHAAMTEQELMSALVQQGLTERVNDIFGYHFSLNEAIRAFSLWLNAIAASINNQNEDYTIQTNCHEFTKRQVLWLKAHYAPADHRFEYIPLTYPKVK